MSRTNVSSVAPSALPTRKTRAGPKKTKTGSSKGAVAQTIVVQGVSESAWDIFLSFVDSPMDDLSQHKELIADFVKKDILPDLVDFYELYGEAALIHLLQNADKADPMSVVNIMPFQDVHKATHATQTKFISGENRTIQTEGVVKCPKCHKNYVNYITVQMRRADEPPSLICECFKCGHKWTQSSA